MKIGVPKEIKPQENRIGLTPDSVKNLVSNGNEVLVEKDGGFEAGFYNDHYKNAGAKIVEKPEDIFNEAEIIVKVWGYDHGGLSISTTRSGQFADEWDSGLLGVIYATKNDILENFTGWNSYGIRKPMRKYLTKKLRKMATRRLESEVRTYNRYLNNEIVCYTLYDKDGKEIDRLSGIYILDNEDELDAVLSEIGSKREDWES